MMDAGIEASMPQSVKGYGKKELRAVNRNYPVVGLAVQPPLLAGRGVNIEAELRRLVPRIFRDTTCITPVAVNPRRLLFYWWKSCVIVGRTQTEDLPNEAWSTGRQPAHTGHV
jgi:hypothetical protein